MKNWNELEMRIYYFGLKENNVRSWIEEKIENLKTIRELG
jgi:hypothetical protein